jgi:hypothetical protein
MGDSYYYGIEEARVSGSGKTWRCILCGPMNSPARDDEFPNIMQSDEDRKRHAQSFRHKIKGLEDIGLVTSIGKTVLRRNTSALDLERRADRLQYLKWQLHVKGVLYDYMKLDINCLIADEAPLLVQATTLLQKYEHMERLSLLELAVWKAACISRATRVELDSMASMKSVEDAVLFVANNHRTWKEHRTETRKTNAIEIVIKRVLPFLGTP